VNTEQIAQDIRGFLLREFLYMRPDFPLALDTPLLSGGIIDSMGVLELLGFLDDRFGVVPAEEEVTEANFGTIAAIAELVARRQTSRAVA
jgi:acyl carrier protein